MSEEVYFDYPIHVRPNEPAEPFDPQALAAELVANRASRPEMPIVETAISPVIQDLGVQRSDTGGSNPPLRHWRTDRRAVSARPDMPAAEARYDDLAAIRQLNHRTMGPMDPESTAAERAAIEANDGPGLALMNAARIDAATNTAVREAGGDLARLSALLKARGLPPIQLYDDEYTANMLAAAADEAEAEQATAPRRLTLLPSTALPKLEGLEETAEGLATAAEAQAASQAKTDGESDTA
jgi:hypothetical protein